MDCATLNLFYLNYYFSKFKLLQVFSVLMKILENLNNYHTGSLILNDKKELSLSETTLKVLYYKELLEMVL
jgi:hypothetical protein